MKTEDEEKDCTPLGGGNSRRRLVTASCLLCIRGLICRRRCDSDAAGTALRVDLVQLEGCLIRRRNGYTLRSESDPIWPYMQNSLVVAACVSVLTVGIVLPAAYTFSRYRSRSSRVVMISLLFFRMIPIIALAIPVYFLMRTLGLLGSWQSLVFAQLIYTVPLAAWLMKGYFDMLPIEIEESALIDGASRLTILRRIVIPLSRPGLAVAVMFSFLLSYIEYLFASSLPSTIQSTMPVRMGLFITPHMTLWRPLAVTALLSAVPMIILFLLLQRHLVRGLTFGAVKQ